MSPSSTPFAGHPIDAEVFKYRRASSTFRGYSSIIGLAEFTSIDGEPAHWMMTSHIQEDTRTTEVYKLRRYLTTIFGPSPDISHLDIHISRGRPYLLSADRGKGHEYAIGEIMKALPQLDVCSGARAVSLSDVWRTDGRLPESLFPFPRGRRRIVVKAQSIPGSKTSNFRFGSAQLSSVMDRTGGVGEHELQQKTA